MYNFLFQTSFGAVSQKSVFKKFVPEIKKVDETSNKFQSTIV